MVDTALDAGSFKTLISAVIAAGLGESLKGTGPFTVFAPQDAAFANLPTGTLESLLNPENREKLKAILTFHVVAERLTAGDLLKRSLIKTVNGKDLTARFDVAGVSGAEFRGSLRIAEAKILKADIGCTNGIIHVVDRVLLPED